MILVGMNGHATFKASRKVAAVAFVLLILLMSKSMKLHFGPTKCWIFAVGAFKCSCYWRLTVEADCMNGHVTFKASRKTAVIAFKFLFLDMLFIVTLHGGPPKCRKLTIGAFIHTPSVSSFRPLLVVLGRFNRLHFNILQTYWSSNIHFLKIIKICKAFR